jgi:predicted metal-dependent peptidase
LLAGLDLHIAGQRGTLPAALVQEIRALAHPPITWDVALARWFDEHFPAAERSRTYSRLSRRSAATPDIPRPGYRLPEELLARRTFGVVLDTSMSMTTTVLGKALGAIASYAAAHDVPAARVVYCDAAAYDAGYLSPDDIADRVRITGRGGTVLQPGIDLIERAKDFPSDGPILVITDGWCDTLRVRREHAYLIPAGASLPFTAKGPVFRID